MFYSNPHIDISIDMGHSGNNMKAVIYNNILCEEKFSPSSTQTTLEYLESQGLVINYHCRDGTCGACRCALNSGKVAYTTEPLAYIRQGDILACCTRPLTDIDLSGS